MPPPFTPTVQQRLTAMVMALRNARVRDKFRNEAIVNELDIRTHGLSSDQMRTDIIEETMASLAPKAKRGHVARAVREAEEATREEEYAEFCRVFQEQLEIIQAMEIIEKGVQS